MAKNNTDKIGARDLPALISAVLRHPKTPPLLYNVLREALTEMSNHIDYQSPEMVLRALAAYAASETERQSK
jgi:hypothetical protein